MCRISKKNLQRIYMIKWLIQSVGKNVMIQDNFITLQNNNFKYMDFAVISDSVEIINLENILSSVSEEYIVRGGVKIVNLIDSMTDIEEHCKNLTTEQINNKNLFLQKLKNSIFYDRKKFDQAYYSTLDLPLLNSRAFFLSIENNLHTTFTQPYFIKPSQDLKSFLPGILPVGQSIQQFIENTSHTLAYKEENLLVAPVVNIKEEYRFFVINTEVITGSLYKRGDKIIYSSAIADNIIKIARDYAKLYQPSSVYTMDIALTDTGPKIVEYNCWNGSGLYHCNKELLFKEVQNYILNKNKYIRENKLRKNLSL